MFKEKLIAHCFTDIADKVLKSMQASILYNEIYEQS